MRVVPRHDRSSGRNASARGAVKGPQTPWRPSPGAPRAAAGRQGPLATAASHPLLRGGAAALRQRHGTSLQGGQHGLRLPGAADDQDTGWEGAGDVRSAQLAAQQLHECTAQHGWRAKLSSRRHTCKLPPSFCVTWECSHAVLHRCEPRCALPGRAPGQGDAPQRRGRAGRGREWRLQRGHRHRSEGGARGGARATFPERVAAPPRLPALIGVRKAPAGRCRRPGSRAATASALASPSRLPPRAAALRAAPPAASLSARPPASTRARAPWRRMAQNQITLRTPLQAALTP